MMCQTHASIAINTTVPGTDLLWHYFVGSRKLLLQKLTSSMVLLLIGNGCYPLKRDDNVMLLAHVLAQWRKKVFFYLLGGCYDPLEDVKSGLFVPQNFPLLSNVTANYIWFCDKKWKLVMIVSGGHSEAWETCIRECELPAPSWWP